MMNTNDNKALERIEETIKNLKENNFTFYYDFLNICRQKYSRLIKQLDQEQLNRIQLKVQKIP